MQQQDIHISFILTHRETSKDSNSETITIEISNSKISISKTYGGFKAQDNVSCKKKMTDEMKQKIWTFIEENSLNTNLSEAKETENIGISGSICFEIKSPIQTKINIEGKTNIWGNDEYVKKNWGRKYVKSRTNIKNIEYFDIATGFVFLIENL